MRPVFLDEFSWILEFWVFALDATLYMLGTQV
jgi:hypothetical protein